MVIGTYVDCFSSERILVPGWGWVCFAAVRAHGGAAKQLAVVLGKVLGFAQNVMTFRIGDFVKNIVMVSWMRVFGR